MFTLLKGIKLKPYLLIAVCFLAGCGAHSVRLPEWQAIDGSRADGTVTLSYEQNFRSRLTPRTGQDNEVAKTRCRVWGYTSAEPFGGSTRSCVATPVRANAKVSCLIWRYEKRYQCTNHASDKIQHAPMQQQPIQNNITIELSPTNMPQVKSH